MFSLKKSMILFILCTCILTSASCAFANDSNQTCNLADAGNLEMNLDVADGHSSADAIGNDTVKISQSDLNNAGNCGPGLAAVDNGYYWCHYVAGEIIGGGLVGGIVAIPYYFTD